MAATVTLAQLKSAIQDVPQKVTILAVSKLQPISKILELLSQGQLDFGENYVQEVLEKQQALSDYDNKIRWHLIGHLQKKKVNSIIGKFQLIHSIDSFELAQLIGKKSFEKQLIQDVLLQVNIAKEPSKEGLTAEELKNQWPAIQEIPGLRIRGLMTMPPLAEAPEESRPWFQELKLLQEDLKNNCDLNRHPMDQLSMGTSGDWKIAIAEGATIVRIGTILFGERPPKD